MSDTPIPPTDLRSAVLTPDQIAETAFEKRRGISSVETRTGYAQAHVFGLREPLSGARIEVLDRVASAEISIDFLKFTQNGLSFIVHEAAADRLSNVLEQSGFSFEVSRNRHIVLVHAVNMRDEEGLIADVMQAATRSGVEIEHVTDMHDRMLMVVDAADSQSLCAQLMPLQQNGGAHAL